MAALDLDALEAIIATLCPHCTPSEYLSELTCLGARFPPSSSCQDDGEERRRVLALAALCLTSKQLSALATRHLYHRPTATSWSFLARTLLARPDLALHVRHLSTRNWKAKFALFDKSFPPEVVRYWASRVTYPVAEWFAGPQKKRNMEDAGQTELFNARDISLSILVALCPGLEELNAVLEQVEDPFTLSEPGSLPRLRTVALTDEHRTGGVVSLDDLRTLSPAAPNLSTVVGWQMGDSNRVVPLGNVTRLRLGWSYLCHSELHALLQSCPRLESFEYRAGPMDPPTQFSPLEAQLALVEFAPRLKSLVLDLNGAKSRHLTLGGTNWVLGSLAGLRELSTLEVDTRCIVPHANPIVQTVWEHWPGPVPPYSDGALVELLPESICELKIIQGSYGPGPEGLEVALGVLATEAGRFPALREVRMEVRVEDGWEGEEGVRTAFEARGVRFVVHAMAELHPPFASPGR